MKQGVPGDPAHQRHQVHHVAQRLVPVRDHPEEMVGSLHCRHSLLQNPDADSPSMRMQCNACSHLLIQAVSIATYVGSLLGVVLMYVWYAPSPACRLNILFITVTLVLVQLMTFVSTRSKASSTRTYTYMLELGDAYVRLTASLVRWLSRPLAWTELTGEGRVPGAWADGDLRRVPVLVGDQKVRDGSEILSVCLYCVAASICN
jgi:hypothetical protein